MPLLRRALGVAGWSALGTVVAFAALTRKSKVYDVPDTDYLLGTTLFARFNPYDNPVMKDVCVRRVPLGKIRPELLEEGQEGRVVEAFCAGVFGGWGYTIQRRYLERKYRNQDTAAQLWDANAIKASRFETGTVITDHFEVINKTENSIILRCGDSPRINELRASDGLFELTTEVHREEGIVEFGLKSVFYSSLELPKTEGKAAEPMDGLTKWAHQKYDKLLMETAVRNCMR